MPIPGYPFNVPPPTGPSLPTSGYTTTGQPVSATASPVMSGTPGYAPTTTPSVGGNQTSNPFSLVPTINTNASGSASTTGQQSTQQQQVNNNLYGQGQTNLQGQLGSLYSSLLGGNIPSSYTANPNLVGAYNTNFNQSVAPGIASQLGANSPAIASQQAMGLQSLLANQYNTGVNEYQNSLNSGAGYALTPTGNTGTGVANQQAEGLENQSSNTTVSYPQDLLSGLTNVLAQSPNWNPFSQ